MNKLFQLSFVPRSTDFALLVLRLWLGLTMFFNHGLAKLLHFSQVAPMMPDPLHLGASASLGLVVIGVATRFTALVIVIEMLVAFYRVHQGTLAMGPHSGELAFMYLGGFLTIVLAGGGRFGVCNKTNAPAS
jgi:putative oxidoreductase